MVDSDDKKPSIIHRELHVNYFLIASNGLPSHYVGLDNSKLSAIYFIVVALDLLDAIDQSIKEKFIEAIYFHQLKPSCEDDIVHGVFGFIGGSFLINDKFPSLTEASNRKYFQGHIAMIYTALATLLTLGDDLSRVDRESIRKGEQCTSVGPANH